MAGHAIVDDVDVMDAIRDHPHHAAEALTSIQVAMGATSDLRKPLTAESLAAAAAGLGDVVEELWVAQLKKRGLLAPFIAALKARGVGLGGDVVDGFADHVDRTVLARFLAQSEAFRCQVLVGGRPAGSGCLIGPSQILTAWHVIAVQAPGQPQEPAPQVEVLLDDGSRHDVVIPPLLESLCGDDEYRSRAPRRDDEVAGRHDVAVLRLRRPAATHLGHVRLPETVGAITTGSFLTLVHFPEGQDKGFVSGKVAKIRNVSARWRHDISTSEGSSGGACFNRDLALSGVHQGRLREGGRFVPLLRFLDDLRPYVAADVAPTKLWSLDGTPAGTLVVGRALLFEAIAACGDDAGRVRGLRVKRRDRISGTTVGLAFTHDILGSLLERRGPDHLLVRLQFDEFVHDAAAVIRSRVVEAGLSLPEQPSAPSVAPGAAAPEGVARDRATSLAAAINGAADRAGRTVWLFLDHPSVTVSDNLRLTLDSFLEAALLQPHLRLVVAGFETIPLPGQEFPAPSEATVLGPPGLVVEWVGSFTAADVRDTYTLAAQDLTGHAPDRTVMNAVVDRVLRGVPELNGTYRDDDLETVVAALRPDLSILGGAGR